METPPIPSDDEHRVAALHSMRLLDTPVEERFERITRLARTFYDMPMAALSLIDSDRQWCKSEIGLPLRETGRDISICGHTIAKGEMLVVSDTLLDPRFVDNPLVTGDPFIRFYAGVPLRGRDRARVATLCVLDNRPHHAASLNLQVLQDLAALAEREFMFESPLNSQSVDPARAADGLLLLDEVTGLWNWNGITRLLEESSHRIRLIGGVQTLVWLHVDYTLPPNPGAGAINLSQRALAAQILSSLDYQDTAGAVTGGQFLMILNDGNRDSLITRLAMMADKIRRGYEQTDATLHQLRFSARMGIPADLGIADLTEQLEQALPPFNSPLGTLVVQNYDQSDRIQLLR